MLTGKRASVEPRVVSPECGYALPLVDLIEPYLGHAGVITLHGWRGSGRTTALRHLLAALPGQVAVFDSGELGPVKADQLVVRVGPRAIDDLASFEMAQWGRDEAIEHLMHSHPDRCGDVMRRLAEHADEFDETSPALWRAVLDGMARCAGIGPRDALSAAIGFDPDRRWLRHDLVRTMALGMSVAMRVIGVQSGEWLRQPDRDVLREAVRRLRTADEAVPMLRRHWLSGDAGRQPLVASLLVGLGAAWRPLSASDCELGGADLAGASWAGIRLPGVGFVEANLDAAHLEGADLTGAQFFGASLVRTQLDGALLRGASFSRADLTGASLRNAHASEARFLGADLSLADLTGANLTESELVDVNLRGARLLRSDLSFATLRWTNIEEADFSRANLAHANLRGADLRPATWTGAHFEHARLEQAQLEGLVLPGAIFDGAKLTRAHLTDSVMPHASFRGADLRYAMLGDIAWEGADLRDADLSRVNFHMGSSREGVLDSVTPSEGTRTGYYTDDFEEQSYKAPEEIRKANLRGADLRGANVAEADFYLVDLRGARYDRAQAHHFRACGAILHAHRR